MKLFGANDKVYTTNGDKILQPTYAVVTKEDNGDYYLEIELGLEYVDLITPNKLIVANTPTGYQAFRITDTTKRKHKIVIKAWHVSYDSKNYVIQDSYVVDKSCNDALIHLNNATDNTSPFTVASDIATIKSYRCVRKSLYEAWQVVLERWGGHIKRDNFDVGIYATIGQDNGVVVRYGKNEKDITATYDWTNVVTKLMPVGRDGVMLDQVYLVSETQYDIPYTKVVSFDQNDINQEDYETETDYINALKADLLSQATDYLTKNCVPQVNYNLQANLEKVTDVGDTIHVIDERLGINLTTNLISYKYDCILEKYIDLQFGNFQKTLNNLMSTINTSTNEIVNTASDTLKSKVDIELQEATDQIMGVLGNSYVIYDGDKILVVDSLPKETATNVIRINSAGIGFSTTGINGTFNSAWLINGTMNMQYINVLNLLADSISGGTLNLSNGISINSNKFTVNSNGEIISTGGKIGGYTIGSDKLYAEIFAPHDFTQTDIDKIMDYILGIGTLTPEELELYDVNNDGVVNSSDVFIIKRWLQFNMTTSKSAKIIMATGDNIYDNAYSLEDGDGNEIFRIGFDGIKWTGEHQVLWEGVQVMNDQQTIDLSSTPISQQTNGIMLIWSAYDNNQAQNYDFVMEYIPKEWVSMHSTRGVSKTMSTGDFTKVGAKYLYFTDTTITGNVNNSGSGTASGIQYKNYYWVLRYIIGV